MTDTERQHLPGSLAYAAVSAAGKGHYNNPGANRSIPVSQPTGLDRSHLTQHASKRAAFISVRASWVMVSNGHKGKGKPIPSAEELDEDKERTQLP